MNILDNKKNPIYRILETVKMEARRFHVEVLSSEIVGLLPKEAVFDSVKYYMQCEGLNLDKNASLDELTTLAKKYLMFRDFDRFKMIEANL
jgi:glutamate formiminotransferase